MKSALLVCLLAACAGTPPPPKQPAEPAGRAASIPHAELDVFALEDGHLVVPNDGKLLGVGRSPAEIGDVLAAAGLPRDTIRLDIQILVVKAVDRVILFDAGAGAFIPTAGHLMASLARTGIRPIAVTDIFISHAHSDHIGGLVGRDGALAFPAATIRMSAAEWAALQAETDADSARFVAAIAPKVVAFEPGAQVLPVVKAIATPGHTVGHCSYEIGAAADRLLYLGDIAHHAVLSLRRPTWSIAVDADRPAAEALRQQTLARLATSGARVFAGHFPFPGVGRFVTDGDRVTWKAAR